jgi:dTDP-glucose 4,6-dehydratase
VDRLTILGHDVVVVDSMLTGREKNLASCSVEVITDDITTWDASSLPRCDYVWHLASPASPPVYQEHPFTTLYAGSVGTLKLLAAARDWDAEFLLASTSEVYGDPQVHPQPETYWGNVNPIGPRSCYDEAKRFAEAATATAARQGQPTHIARIFNTYGPRMRSDDGRVVPTFIGQALRGEALTVHGSGQQTRSLCFVDDTVDGLIRLMMSGLREPVNIGNPTEVTMLELAKLIATLVNSSRTPRIAFTRRPVDDPERRCPSITRARTLLGWSPSTPLMDGLSKTIEWFASEMEETA